MLEGVELVSQLLAQYRAIEQTYAQLESDLSDALRKTLLEFYVIILKFQVRAIKYFDRDHKSLRAVKGLNPVSADETQQQRAAIEGKIDVCLNQRAKYGRTALMEACMNNYPKITRLLLEAGAGYTISANANATALH